MALKTKATFLKRALAWSALLIIAATAFLFVAVPVRVIMPFSPQTASGLNASMWLKSWSPIATVVLAIAAFAVAVYIWRNSRWLIAKAFLIVPLALVLVFAWFARQNHFEWMFNPLANSAYARVAETDFVADDDMVLAVNLNGESVAYPVRQMAYHHIAHDVVGGTPITATY